MRVMENDGLSVCIFLLFLFRIEEVEEKKMT